MLLATQERINLSESWTRLIDNSEHKMTLEVPIIKCTLLRKKILIFSTYPKSPVHSTFCVKISLFSSESLSSIKMREIVRMRVSSVSCAHAPIKHGFQSSLSWIGMSTCDKRKSQNCFDTSRSKEIPASFPGSVVFYP